MSTKGKATTPKATKSRKGKGGPKDQYPVKVQPYLDLIKSWAREGMLEKDIAKSLGISEATWYSYKNKYPELVEALRLDRNLADAKVENALYKNAINGNVTAQIFWLKNRQSEKWNKKAPDAEGTKVEVNVSYDDLMKAQIEYDADKNKPGGN